MAQPDTVPLSDLVFTATHSVHHGLLQLSERLGQNLTDLQRREFTDKVLGMKVLRHEENEAACEITCNGDFDNAWSKTIAGGRRRTRGRRRRAAR